MPLTRWERKSRLKHGDQKRIAKRVNRAESDVSSVIHGHKRIAIIEKECARRMRPFTTPEEAFGPLPSAVKPALETASSAA